ncbi:hypothetical protein OE766_23645 [Pararhizobium sp. YC-54]|uniref:hypothetical protein n=1 Tax=Pararhizobium sp. YC-54 TaxID=2986920 RepID=UPI0021F6F619|nr:hypothetical protein [Pararhizobium sp. YC-54]MCW0001219.1 hypothetical protein [Pararhizobium sp. YC-54]
MISTEPADLSLPQLSYRQAAMAVEIRALTLCLEWKAGFRPEQPRVPAGNPDGGQWVGDGSESRPIRVSRRGPRGGGAGPYPWTMAARHARAGSAAGGQYRPNAGGATRSSKT